MLGVDAGTKYNSLKAVFRIRIVFYADADPYLNVDPYHLRKEL